MNKILITGANGYIGARLSKSLSEKGDLITGLCYPNIPNNKNWQKHFNKLIVGDISKSSTLNKLKNSEFDIIIHLVSLDHHKSNLSPELVNNTNVLPTWTLLDYFANKGLKKFIYFSTIHVYGKLPNEKIKEDRLPKPIHPYGLTHYMSEQIVNMYNRQSETSCINVRLSNSYGSPILSENNCWSLVVNDLCRNAYLNNEIKLMSDGSPQRDFIHGNDVYQAVKILINNSTKSEANVYHISSSKTLTILEIAYKVKTIYKQLFNVEIPIRTLNQTIDLPSNINDKKYLISNEKISKIGFKQQINLEQGIYELFNYLKTIGK